MAKFNNTQWIWVLGIITIVVALTILIVNLSKGEPELQATISHSVINKGEVIDFKDETKSANQWLWEFGNSDFLEIDKGSYRYTQSGKYQVRLTVNNKYYKTFIIEVRETSKQEDIDKLAEIIASSSAFQGEFVVFSGIGDDKEWRWIFGESGIVDSRDKNPIYSYKTPGTYEVRLTTESTRYPIRHRIKILPKYKEEDSTDIMMLIAADIKKRLQNIANGKSFNVNYNYILKKYLNTKSDMEIIINNNKKNDFYSYCQGLRHLGKDRTIIENIIIETEDTEGKIITKLRVMQLDK